MGAGERHSNIRGTIVAQIEQARLMRTAEPFVAAERERIAADRGEIHGNHADGLSAIDVEPNATCRGEGGNLAHGHHESGGARDVADLDHARARRHEFADAGEVGGGAGVVGDEDFHLHAAQVGLVVPSERTARVRVRFENDFVAFAQFETGGDDGRGFGGVARETDFVGLHAGVARERLAGRLDQSVTGFGMLLELEHRGENFIEHRLRRGSETADVEVSRVIKQRKLGADGAPVGFSVARWKRRERSRRGFARRGGASGRAERERTERADPEILQKGAAVGVHAMD